MEQRNSSDDIFDHAYQRPGLLFGAEPTKELQTFLDAHDEVKGKALDIGCGDGRDTLPLLKRGFTVTAVDKSRFAIEKMLSREDLVPVLKEKLNAVVSDVLDWDWPENEFNLIVAVTLLDHLDESKASNILNLLSRAAKTDAIIFIQVHTVDDPAVVGLEPKSEFAPAIKHYFDWNELLRLFMPHSRVLFYDDRIEWDYDHGKPHTHGFATLIARITRRV